MPAGAQGASLCASTTNSSIRASRLRGIVAKGLALGSLCVHLDHLPLGGMVVEYVRQRHHRHGYGVFACFARDERCDQASFSFSERVPDLPAIPSCRAVQPETPSAAAARRRKFADSGSNETTLVAPWLSAKAAK
jgi:hypothetical protein